MKTYNNLLHEHKKAFIEADVTTETIKVFLYELCFARDINLYLHLDDEADPEVAEVFEAGIQRLLNHEPLNYVLGYCWFYGYKLNVDDNVLIPRYETEELIGNTLALIDENFADYQEIKLADIGTGSGAIAIALAKEEPKLKVYASDISEGAIQVAKANAKLNGADIEFSVGNMLDPLIEKGIKLDVLISNPPYIPSEEDLEVSVKDFEPHVALFGGADGLKYYREIFENAHLLLNEHAMLGFEIGYDQRESLTKVAKEYFPEASVEVIKDINGKDRMMFIIR